MLQACLLEYHPVWGVCPEPQVQCSLTLMVSSMLEALLISSRGSGDRGNGCLQSKLMPYRGGALPAPPWNLVGRVLNRVQQQQVTFNSVDEPTMVSQAAQNGGGYSNPPLPSQEGSHPTYPDCVPEVIPTLATLLTSGNITRTKSFGRGLRNPPSPIYFFLSGWSGAVSVPVSGVVNFLASSLTFSRMDTSTT